MANIHLRMCLLIRCTSFLLRSECLVPLKEKGKQNKTKQEPPSNVSRSISNCFSHAQSTQDSKVDPHMSRWDWRKRKGELQKWAVPSAAQFSKRLVSSSSEASRCCRQRLPCGQQSSHGGSSFRQMLCLMAWHYFPSRMLLNLQRDFDLTLDRVPSWNGLVITWQPLTATETPWIPWRCHGKNPKIWGINFTFEDKFFGCSSYATSLTWQRSWMIFASSLIICNLFKMKVTIFARSDHQEPRENTKIELER